MNILFLVRSTLFNVYGGDTVQIVATAKYLRKLGVSVDIKLSNEQIDYSFYDLLHVFNIVRPHDAMRHIKQSKLPYVLSTIFIDFSEYQKQNTGIRSTFSKYCSPDQIEYLKAIARWVKNGEIIQSKQYIIAGHKKAVQQVTQGASYLLPNSESEYRRFVTHYNIERPYRVIYNGLDLELFNNKEMPPVEKEPFTVLCVARIEGNKNQLNLIKAMNNTAFKLKLIGKPAPNHLSYYNACKNAAAANVSFVDFMPQEQLVPEYRAAKVHVLPSWNETCGLTSMEAAYNRCNIVITDKGDTVEYYGRYAWYCDPSDPQSIYDAVVQASQTPEHPALREKIEEYYNWERAALVTRSVYEEVLGLKGKKNTVMISRDNFLKHQL